MESSRQGQSGYKKNWGKWIAIYLAIGGLAYLIVSLVMSGNGSGGGSGGY